MASGVRVHVSALYASSMLRGSLSRRCRERRVASCKFPRSVWEWAGRERPEIACV